MDYFCLRSATDIGNSFAMVNFCIFVCASVLYE